MEEMDFIFGLMIIVSLGLLFSIMALYESVIAFIGTIIFISFMFLVLTCAYILSNTDADYFSNEFVGSVEKTETNPVNVLQNKFAEGEITEREFEEKLDKIAKSQDIAKKVDDNTEDIFESIEKS